MKEIKLVKINTESEYCDCAETFVWNLAAGVQEHVKKPRWHNCEYIRKVNAKIDGNCILADRLADPLPDKTPKQKEDRKAAWQRAFAKHMDYDRYTIMLEMENFEKTLAESIARKDQDDHGTRK
jgi:hypothetical protein